jgi:hypothetical protein
VAIPSSVHGAQQHRVRLLAGPHTAFMHQWLPYEK